MVEKVICCVNSQVVQGVLSQLQESMELTSCIIILYKFCAEINTSNLCTCNFEIFSSHTNYL